jgi:ABC-type uncharacterized transport system permease subunit
LSKKKGDLIMVEVELTWGRVVKVWWSLLWRGLLLAFLVGAVLGFIIGFVGGVARIDKTIISRLCLMVGALSGIPVGLWVLKKVLQKKFGDFRIALLKEVGCARTEKDIPATLEFDIS